DNSPHIIKSEKTAMEDNLFKKISGLVSSQTVIAHIRTATLGSLNILNTHPFQYGSWVFAHNGNIKNFQQHRKKLINLISSQISNYIFGDTDSEVIFFILLTELLKIKSLSEDFSMAEIQSANSMAITKINQIVGPCLNQEDGPPEETYLTYILTNGKTLLAHQGGKKLYYSTYKNRCRERDTCAFYAKECESPVQKGHINHLIFSSEQIAGDNIWLPLKFGETMGVDANMNLHRTL
ncbi:MAG: class II glutamine amidotransferase, partial [Bdellovibrionales bacterium]|nr:class II glutamine amidotransferase [Bdellovibrionales bacterium]